VAISRMQRATFLAPRDVAEDLPAFLQTLGTVHVEDYAARLPEDELDRLREPADVARSHLKQIDLVEGVFSEFAPATGGFFAGLVNAPLRVAEDEVRRAVHEFDLASVSSECRHASDAYRRLQRQIEAIEAEIAALEFFARLPVSLADIRSLRSVRVWVVRLIEAKWDAFQADEWVREHLACEEIARGQGAVNACVVAVAAEAEEAEAALKRQDALVRPLPDLDTSEGERLVELRTQAAELREQARKHVERIAELAEGRRQVALLRAHWEAELARIEAMNRAGASARLVVMTGYVRARDAAGLQEALAQRFPRATVLLEKPTGEDNVPVSLELGPVLRPMRTLVHMFGMPDYFSFDPTPYLSLSFLIFFGCCFGDVFYGLMLCAVAGWLAWKARRYEGHYDLCMLFLYGGLATIVVGVLTGTWAGDLWQAKYLGEGNLLLRIKEATALVDPLDKAVLVLLVTLGIGVVTQFYGIVLKGYGLLRRGDVAGAVFDAGLWLLALPSFLIVVSKLFFPTPAALFHAGAAVFTMACIGLVLTQGRKEESLAGKLITGLVSLYGILGGYGCVTFVGDMLSYARLLALGLTTAIIGMSINVIANLVRGAPLVGGLLFVAVLVLGHVFNFAVCILGAFVHSARLIFLEFFSRFYSAGGVPFRPLTLSTDKVLVVGNESGE
jgi:V/A-type H+-transporting ATPase subunit I